MVTCNMYMLLREYFVCMLWWTFSPYMLNDEVANLHVKRNRLVVASCLDIEDVIMCGNN